MPTHNRRPFVARAIELFRRQDYPRKELIVVDDGSDPVRDLVPADDDRIRYLRLERRTTLGAKRNLACEQARGALIAHWDDDDWHAAHRLSYQVEALVAAGADVCGTDTLLFYDTRSGRAWRYLYGKSSRRWLAGGTLCYTRAFWSRQRFANINVGEDSRFVWSDKGAKLLALPDSTFYVALIHAHNTSPKQTSGSHWRPYPVEEVQRLLGADWSSFAALPSRATDVPPPQDPGRVTVTIPYARCREYVVQAVESILAQTHANLRLVVVSDADPTPPWDLLAHVDDPRLLRFELPENRGRYFADAVVVAATPDPLYLVQDADDWSDPERLAKLLVRLREEHAQGAVSAAFNHHKAGEGAAKLKDYFPLRGESLTPDNLHRVNHHGLFRVAALRRVGGYYGGQRIGYDTLLGNFLLMTGHVAYVDEPLYHRRLRSDSLCSSPDTGMGTPARRAAGLALQESYGEAYLHYLDYRQGSIDDETLAARIRRIRDQRVSSEDQAALQREATRLAALMAEQDEHWTAAPGIFGPLSRDPNTAAGSRPPLTADRRLIWDHWTISPRLAAALAERLDERAPKRVLELGSGLSTLVLAEYAARSGANVVSLEHDPHYHARTVRLLTSLDLRAYVDLRLAPLAPIACANGRRFPWYGVELDGAFDFVFVDGPPLRYGRQAALFAIHDHLEPTWELWLKDGHRPHEQECVGLWRSRVEFDGALYDLDPRGVWILRSPGSHGAGDPPWLPRQRLPTPLETDPDPVPLPSSPRREAPPRPQGRSAGDSVPIPSEEPTGATVRWSNGHDPPLVSCIMPTFDRRRFVPQAIAQFQRQDYPRRELVVVDDGSDRVGDLIPEDPSVRYVCLPSQLSIGAKRNLACERARGEIVVCWDDDDWYADTRISYQVASLLSGRADANGFTESLVMDLPSGQCWRCSSQLQGRMFVQGIVSGTLAFWRRFWQGGARFPDASLAEDAAFQKELVNRGARLEKLPNHDQFIYIRHGKNSWQFKPGQFLDSRGWRSVPPPDFVSHQDLAFYRGFSHARTG
jgi:glycosyltransferase involved in cell wall biosynthesis